jgi:hypothetical protein
MNQAETDRFFRLQDFLNMVGKSGIVNPKPIIREMAQLLGLKPEEIFYSSESK